MGVGQNLRVLAMLAGVVVTAAGASAFTAGTKPVQLHELTRPTTPEERAAFAESGRLLEILRTMVFPHQTPGKTPNAAGNDSCRYANDMECDHPGIGTGACAAATDYSDCFRIELGREDNSCEWANDNECDEPGFGTDLCTQGTDQNDCVAAAYLRFQTDACVTAFDGICNEPGNGNATCDARTDRSDCLGRERPMTIRDHYFGFDDRILMDTAVFPWSVIGVLDLSDGSCTASLIAEDILVTAAHCIEMEDGSVNARSEFITAFNREGGPLTAAITAYFQSPERATDVATSDENATSDWVLLRIDRPLGRELGFLGARDLAGGNIKTSTSAATSVEVFQAGYSWDTGENLSGNIGCHISRLEVKNTLVHTCDTTQGDSGSPLMIREGDQYFVIATDSTARYVENSSPINIATRSEAWISYVPQFQAGEVGTMVATPATKLPK